MSTCVFRALMIRGKNFIKRWPPLPYLCSYNMRAIIPEREGSLKVSLEMGHSSYEIGSNHIFKFGEYLKVNRNMWEGETDVSEKNVSLLILLCLLRIGKTVKRKFCLNRKGNFLNKRTQMFFAPINVTHYKCNKNLLHVFGWASYLSDVYILWEGGNLKCPYICM